MTAIIFLPFSTDVLLFGYITWYVFLEQRFSTSGSQPTFGSDIFIDRVAASLVVFLFQNKHRYICLENVGNLFCKAHNKFNNLKNVLTRHDRKWASKFIFLD